MKSTLIISSIFFSMNLLCAYLTDDRGYYFLAGYFAATTMMCSWYFAMRGKYATQ